MLHLGLLYFSLASGLFLTQVPTNLSKSRTGEEMWGEKNHPWGEKEHPGVRGNKEKGEGEPHKPVGREKPMEKALQPDTPSIKVHL